MRDPIKNKRVGDIIKISILRLLRTIIRIIRGSIDTLDTKRTQRGNTILCYDLNSAQRSLISIIVIVSETVIVSSVNVKPSFG
jgi:hypothetical protein